MNRRTADHFGGCLPGGAVGDALGALLGKKAIPAWWCDQVELRNAVEILSEDLLVGYCDTDDWRVKYPPDWARN